MNKYISSLLLEKCQYDDSIVILSPDIGTSLNSKLFEEKFGIFSKQNYKSRFIKMPLAENLTLSVAEGIMYTGLLPIVWIYDGLINIVIEEISSLARSMNHDSNCIIIVTTHAGFSSPDGRVIQSVCSPALIMSIPYVNFFEPVDEIDAREIVETLLEKRKGLNIIRCTKYYSKKIRQLESLKKFSGYYVIYPCKTGGEKIKLKNVSIITNTPFVDPVIDLQNELRDTISIKIIAVNNINQIIANPKGIFMEIYSSDRIVILNDVIKPFLRSFVEHILLEFNENITKPIVLAPEKFGECGSFPDLLAKFRLDKDSLRKMILSEKVEYNV